MKFLLYNFYFFLFFINIHAGYEPISKLAVNFHPAITFIGKTNFKISGPTHQLEGTYTISETGTYVLSETIVSSAASQTVIAITTDHVILDLGGKTITLDQTTSGRTINGISIAAECSNITIKNGTIMNMNGYGIVVNQGCTHITLEDITVLECTTAGIGFLGSKTKPIANGSIKNCTVMHCFGKTQDTYGIYIIFTDFFYLKDCSCIEQYTSELVKNSYGFYAINSKNGSFLNCQAKGGSASLISIGFYIGEGCSLCYIKNCTAANNTSFATSNLGKAYGFFQSKSNNNTFNQCTSTNQTAFALSVGFYTQNCSFSRFEQCLSNNNIATGTVSTTGGYGFLTESGTCQGNFFEKCTATGNKGTTEIISKGCGFSFDNSYGTVIKECTAQYNDGINGTGVGIELKTNTAYCSVIYCHVLGNTSSTLSKAYGIIDYATPSKNLLAANLAFANRDTSLLPLDQNYSVTYQTNNLYQSVSKNNIQNLKNDSYQNMNITP